MIKKEIDNSAFYPEQKSSIDIKKIYNRLIRNWYWLLISIIIGVVIAWFVNHYMPPQYSIYSSLVVNEYEKGMKQYRLDQGTNQESGFSTFLQDHPGRLRSHTLNLNTLKNLGWNISWYQKKLLYDHDLYNDEPYRILLLPDKKNLTDIPININALSNDEFIIEVKAVEDKLSNDFSQKGRFGEKFESPYFNFIIEKSKKDDSHINLFFIINNLSNLATKYQKKVKVIYDDKKPDIMELILSESNPQRGVDFLNGLEETYIEYGLEDKNRVAENTIKFIDNQLKSVNDSLSNSENQFTNFRTRNQAVDLLQEGGLVMTQKATLEAEKASLESRLKYLRNLRNKLDDSRQMKQVVIPSVFGINDQTLNGLVVKLIDLYNKREVLSFSVHEKAPSFISLNREIQSTYDNLLQNITALLTATENDYQNLNRRVGGTSAQLSLLPRTEQRLISLKRNFDLNNELYTFLLKMRAESAISYASNQPDVKVLDPARPETIKQIRPMAMINYSLGFLLGFLIPAFIILFKDFLNNSVQTKEDVEENTRLPIVGMIMHNRNRKDWVVLDHPRSSITESFRLLRTNLKFMLNEKNMKVISVQSNVPGEGKTFISVNLASIFALNNLKVLLVGVDMRMSKLNAIFQKNSTKGLSTYLSNQDGFEDIIESTALNNLKFVPSGPIPPNPAELLENGNFEKFIDEAKKHFDYIILDSPPISIVTDGIITGQYSDVNLFVVRFRYSNKQQVNSLNTITNSNTLPHTALVLNDAINDNFLVNYYDKKVVGYYVSSN